jgi:hypothetical protein
LLFALAPWVVGSSASAQAPFQTSAPYALLMDAETGSVLFEKSPDTPVSPASTVKIMTAELVFRELKAGRLKLDDEFTVSENAWRTGGAMARGSSMFASLNSKVRVEDLIRGITIVSGNDAAIILAEGIAGTEQAFADRMTKRAAELGLTNCLFFAPVPKAELGPITASLDCGLMVLKNVPAFYRGTSPNKFFDYLAAGIPVVNNYPGWLADLIGENRCGLVVAPGNASAFADALQSLAADPAGRRAMGAAGRALAEREFARPLLAAEFVSTLEAYAP